MGQPANYTAGSGRQQPRAGARHATIAPYGPFTARDGRTVLLSIQNETEWTRFCAEFLADPGLAADPRFATNTLRVVNREELEAIVDARFAGLDAAEASALLDRAGVANAGVNTVAEFLEHPVLRERKRWRDVGTPGGDVRALLPPISLDGEEPRMDPVPAVGQHTAGVLAELGRSPEEIAGLAARNII
jgi:formyl-CoA transferase